MPYLGGGGPGGSGSPYVRPPPPPPPPRAPVPRAPGQSGQVYTPPPAPRVNPARVNPTAPPTHTDITSSGPGYGSARANAYKQTPAYAHAVQQVFLAQPVSQQAAILRGIRSNPYAVTEARAISSAFRSLSSSQQRDISLTALQMGRGPSLVEQGITGLGHILNPSNVYGGSGKGSTQGGGSLAGVVMFGGGKGAKQLLGNAGKDFLNLPAETFSTVGTLGGDVLSGRPGKAISDFINPAIQLVKHPAQGFYQDPLNSTLTALGIGHGLTRMVAAPIRALAPESAVGRALSTQREGVALTGNLTHERAPYSTSPSVKAGQVAVEAGNYTRAPTGELIPRSEQLRKRLLNQGIGQLVGVRERIRRVNQEQVKMARTNAVTPGENVLTRTGAKAVQGAKTAYKYGARPALIPGAGVLARLADATARRPDTVAQDLTTHMRQVSANRPNLLDDPQGLKAHDAYVKELQAALNNKAFLRNPTPAFRASDAYGRDYPLVEAKANGLGHFGADMTPEGLQRRALMHFAVTHMPGVEYDAQAGLIRPGTRAEVQAEMSRLRGQARTLEQRIQSGRGGVQTQADLAELRQRIRDTWSKQKVPLPTQEIIDHLNGPEGTGGRMPTYTSDVVRFDREQAARSAHYVSSQERPLPTTRQNTLYAYTHGLTDPSHNGLLEQHALMQGFIDAHHAQNTYLETLHTQLPGGGYGRTYAEAKRVAPRGYKPINIAQPFHPQESLDQAIEGMVPATAEEEAMRHSLDLSQRLQPGGAGRWALIDEHALRQLQQHQNQISPNTLLRTIRGLNNQFRTVALSTSVKHLPGVAQENIIRDIAQGVGFRSWITGRRMLTKAEQMDPERGRELRTALTGGQVAGMTEAGRTYRVSEHWAGTSAYPFLKAFEVAAKAPGVRQVNTAWKAWTRLAIHGTKVALEQQHQIAGLGKAALREHGYAEAARAQGFMGLVNRAFGLHGKLLNDATRGLFDPATARRMRAVINQIYGKWTDLSPSAQTALMFSPFGLWWANSARFLFRMPVDQPVKTSLLASATTGTQQERQAKGLDMFMQGALPSYEQGGIPVGGKILAQNYYSPFGIANDPFATAGSLIQPWAEPIVGASLPTAVNWLGKPLSSPTNPRGSKPLGAFDPHRLQYIIDSALSSFVPLYTKAKQVAEGGASAYDTTDNGLNPFPPATKEPGQGPGAGLVKALQPFRSYNATAATTAGGGWGGSSSGSTSSGGWGGSSGTTTGSGGWGGGTSSGSSSGSGGWGS